MAIKVNKKEMETTQACKQQWSAFMNLRTSKNRPNYFNKANSGIGETDVGRANVPGFKAGRTASGVCERCGCTRRQGKGGNTPLCTRISNPISIQARLLPAPSSLACLLGGGLGVSGRAPAVGSDGTLAVGSAPTCCQFSITAPSRPSARGSHATLDEKAAEVAVWWE